MPGTGSTIRIVQGFVQGVLVNNVPLAATYLNGDEALEESLSRFFVGTPTSQLRTAVR